MISKGDYFYSIMIESRDNNKFKDISVDSLFTRLNNEFGDDIESGKLYKIAESFNIYFDREYIYHKNNGALRTIRHMVYVEECYFGIEHALFKIKGNGWQMYNMFNGVVLE